MELSQRNTKRLLLKDGWGKLYIVKRIDIRDRERKKNAIAEL